LGYEDGYSNGYNDACQSKRGVRSTDSYYDGFDDGCDYDFVDSYDGGYYEGFSDGLEGRPAKYDTNCGISYNQCCYNDGYNDGYNDWYGGNDCYAGHDGGFSEAYDFGYRAGWKNGSGEGLLDVATD
jgi:hypothetical protein